MHIYIERDCLQRSVALKDIPHYSHFEKMPPKKPSDINNQEYEYPLKPTHGLREGSVTTGINTRPTPYSQH